MRAPSARPLLATIALAVLIAAPLAVLAASPGQPATDRGVELFRAGDFAGARAAFREAVRLDPGHLKAWENLGWAEHRLGDDAAALRIWNHLLRIDPGRASTLDAIATVEDRRAREAERSARRAEQPPDASRPPKPAAAPPAPDAERAGDTATRAENHAAAERAYRAALAARPGDPRLLAKLARVLEQAGRVSEAIPLWREAAASRDPPPRVHVELGHAYLEVGSVEEARAEYARAVASTPGHDAGALLELAALGFAVGEVEGAERSLTALLELGRAEERWALRAADLFVTHRLTGRGAALLGRAAPDLPGRTRALTRLLTVEAVTAFRAGDFDAAARAYERVISLDGENAAALRDLGWAHRRAGRLDDAERTWRRYARTFPARAAPHDLLADLHLERRAFGAALVESRASLAIDPRSKPATVRTVRSLYGLSRYSEGRRMAAALAARFPDDLQAQRLLAQGLTIMGDFAAAARQWRRVVELEPDGLVARQNWVRALYEAGEPDQAVREARRVAGSPDAPPPMLELIAQDALARGDHAEAASWYRELTRRAPEKLLYWRTLGMTLDRLHLYDEQAAVAREALRHHPERLELQLDLVTALSSARRHGEATALARKILASFPDNRPAYETLVSQLSAAGKLSDALRELSRNHPSFYKEHERRMIEASLRARQNDFAAAARLLRSVADPPPGHHYVPVIVYHGLVPTERTLQTSVDEFEDQMAALAAHGYQAITLADYARMVDGELPVPARPILITFDDARSDSFRNGDPILAKYGLNATMFVPTSRIGVEDGFHVGWNTLARYARSGRWDLQAHGHEAHDPIVIDAAGHKGEFLAYRAWLPAERRSETDTEYVRRLDEDFGRCQRALAERFPDRPILGYAYPLNLLGQAQPGEHAGLPPRNVLLAQRFFRFGFVQDETGYNGFRQGAGAPFLVRRFEVPSGWSGADLVAHLARAHPAAAARLALARLTVDEGRPEAARRIVHEIVRREPLVAGETRRTLAQIAWDQDRTREAASHLAAAPPAQPGASPRRDPLRDQLRWRNAPRVGAEASAFADSDRRSFLDAGVVLRYPLPLPVDVELRASEIRMTEPDMRDMTGLQIAGSVNAGLGERVDLGGWARHRQLSLVPGSLNGGAHLRLRREQHVFALRWAHEDVDTVPAQLLEIGSNVVSTSYEFRSPRWRAQWAVGHRTFDDGNARTDLSGAVLRLLGSGGRWGVGGNVALQDSRVDPAEYYAPRNLVQAVGRLTYRHAWTDSSSVSVDARLGGAHDPVNGLRPSGSAQFRFTRHWGQRRLIGTSLGVDARAVPGYQSLAGMLMIEGRL